MISMSNNGIVISQTQQKKNESF